MAPLMEKCLFTQNWGRIFWGWKTGQRVIWDHLLASKNQGSFFAFVSKSRKKSSKKMFPFKVKLSGNNSEICCPKRQLAVKQSTKATEISSCQYFDVYSWICQKRSPSSRRYASCYLSVVCLKLCRELISKLTGQFL